MNIYEKINQVRQELLGLQIKAEARGYNYNYIDLPKIEGAVTKACGNAGLLTIVDFPAGSAKMDIVNIEKPEEVVSISVPVDSTMVKINDKQPIQNIGGMMTYMRRYLYMTAFSVSEHDAVEDKVMEQESKAEQTEKKPNRSEDEMQERIDMIDFLVQIDPQAIEKLMAVKKVSTVDDLTTDYIRKVYKAKKGESK